MHNGMALMLMTHQLQRLIDSKDFQNMARNAKRWTGSCFIVQAKPALSPDAPLRFGLTASRKVGNAVVRNRCKRRLREVVRALVRDSADAGVPVGGYDVVIIARTCCATAYFKLLQDDLARAWRHLGVLPR